MAESVFGKPIDNAIQEINDKIGTVPSGETVEGQIDALNSNIQTVSTNVGRLLSAAGQGQQTDFNNCKTAGLYKGNSNVTSNTPGNGYWLVLVLVWSANDVVQLAFEINDARACSRSFHDGTTWTAWKRLDNA